MNPRSDADWMRLAVEAARLCPPSERAYSVGAVIVWPGTPAAFVTGYSRQLDDRVHAEEAALAVAANRKYDPAGATLYSTLEPCSVRLSGSTPCAERIAAAGIARVVFAAEEPPLFVDCRGAEYLRGRGVRVDVLPEFAADFRLPNRHLLG